jgi:hypothetical protein
MLGAASRNRDLSGFIGGTLILIPPEGGRR